MKRIYFMILLTICTRNVLLGSKKCFNFTWVGPTINKIDCSDDELFPGNIPCIDPIYNDTRPNTTKIWEDIKNNNSEIANQSVTDCDLACIKYTYIYNGLDINASYFCGKVIEDQTIAVTTGCYVTHTEGYTIEMCACQSEGEEPCNSAIRNTYSITFMAVVSLFIYKIFNIP